VFLVDKGSSFSLAKTSLLPLPDNLKKKPGQALICSLAEIEPVDDVWSSECQDFLRDHCMYHCMALVVQYCMIVCPLVHDGNYNLSYIYINRTK